MKSIKTPLSEIPNITIVGMPNVGKSSLINNILGKEVSIMSSIPGTTTDPVYKRFELGKAGAVSITDTAGLYEEGHLGQKRGDISLKKIVEADIIIFVTAINTPLSDYEKQIYNKLLENKETIIVATFYDCSPNQEKLKWLEDKYFLKIANVNKSGITALIEQMEKLLAKKEPELTPVENLVKEGDLAVLVTPIDLAAPKGRLILPQVETIRDLLDRDCMSLVVKERELKFAFSNLIKPPRLVITDSQSFHKVAADIPKEQALTSFSILFARKKGDLSLFIKGVKALENLPPKPHILMMEACSHHRQADDIGTVKIPRLIKQLIDIDSHFTFTRQLPSDDELKSVNLIVHCGACMITRNQMISKIKQIDEFKIPLVNYGMFLAWANGLLPRALEPIPEAIDIWNTLEDSQI
ncbi:[FeFe] hydrogenase H-cluster maturation GTPase HydF [Spirochaeta cellobiosiphila]|uniref:[FeFe] hydrogenase H-cluster maturation GTPase HydF n=1 Tax=Spirochaeta cellobiosiphila TaxID=504483 RepID=UPI00040055C8|nr:[FeFe] hydrogenase H-cluster maturation GTPase HydF [Spirochaeta cellobiosiphila]